MTTKTQTAVVDESKLILELRIDTQGFVHRTNSSAEKKTRWREHSSRRSIQASVWHASASRLNPLPTSRPWWKTPWRRFNGMV